MSDKEPRIEPSPEVLEVTRSWLKIVRPTLALDFLSAYLTGSVLTEGFDLAHSRINIVVVARQLDQGTLDRLRSTIPRPKKPPHFDPLFLTLPQIQSSLDAFPIEWLEIQERHLRIEGENVFEDLEVPRTYLRLQCEHELRGKNILLRQAYLMTGQDAGELGKVLRANASSFATLFRTLLRLQGETPPADSALVIGRVAEVYQLDAPALLGAHLVRYSGRRQSNDEIHDLFRRFLGEVGRLVNAIDRLHVT